MKRARVMRLPVESTFAELEGRQLVLKAFPTGDAAERRVVFEPGLVENLAEVLHDWVEHRARELDRARMALRRP